MLASLRRVALQVPRAMAGTSSTGTSTGALRAMAGHSNAPYVEPEWNAPAPKLDHVFGDDSYRLNFTFGRMPMMQMFFCYWLNVFLFMFPIWHCVYCVHNQENFEEVLRNARAAKNERDAKARMLDGMQMSS